MRSLALGVSGGVSRVRTMLDGIDLEEEAPDFTDSGMLERTDTLPEEKILGRGRGRS